MSNNQTETLPDIRQSIVINAPIQKVWDAVSNAEGIAAWFMPNDLKPVLGHQFTIDGDQYGISYCKVTELDPPHRLSFNWGEDWRITFELEELEGKTRFTLTHAGWKDAEARVHGSNETNSVIRERMNHGWSAFVLPRLAKTVEA
jgi:uncharacterized protein YndB with AHSA1/START domain